MKQRIKKKKYQKVKKYFTSNLTIGKAPHTKDINQGNLRKRKYSVCENVKASLKERLGKMYRYTYNNTHRFG